MADAKSGAHKPLLRLRSHFVMLSVLYHHPIRVILSLAIPFFMLPELRRAVQFLWKMDVEEARIASIAGIVCAIFLPQLLVTALNCQKVVFDFYDDHVEFTESFLIRDVIKMPYGNLTGVSMRAGFFQRLFGLADVILFMQGRTGRKKNPKRIEQVIHDVKNAPAAAGQVEKILKSWQQREGR